MRRLRTVAEAPEPSGALDRAEVAALLDASRAAGEPIDLRAALSAILDAARSLLGADEGSIQLIDPASKTLWISAARGIPRDIVNETRVPLGHGVSGRVAQTGRPVLLTSPAEVEAFAGLQAKERRISSALCVPMRVRGTVIGVLNLDLMSAARSFTDHDLQLAALFADNAAHAIMGRQLLDRAERQTGEVERLREANAALSSTIDLDRLAEEVLDRALALAGTETGMLCLAGPDGTPVTLARYRSLPRDAVRAALAAPGFPAFLADPVEGLTADDSPLAALAEHVDASLFVVRAVPADDEATGILAVACAPPLEPKVRLLRAYAADASLALGNALLHRKILNREQELATIVDSVPSPIILVDAAARFRAINPAAAELFHLSPEFETGQSVRGKLGAPLEELATAVEETIGREVLVTVGGIPRAYHASATVVRNGSEAGARVLVLYDITAERELEQRKADFLAVIGHELRTPLTAIRGFTLTVLRNGDQLDTATRTESLQRVLVQAERLERLIEDLLFVSRVEEHRPPLHFAWDDAVAVTGAVVDEFRRRSPERTLLMDAWTAEMPVRMDRIKVEQVLYHLVDNALKYSEPDTEVRVSLTQNEQEIEVAVVDRGIGIYSGDVPRLFRAFGQLDASSTRKQGGTGVGLHVAKALVDTFGGRIWVESVLGKGSTFTFTIPRVPPSADDWA